MIGYKIDNNGLYLEPVILTNIENLESNIITTEIPQGLFKAKWNGTDWEEGATQEYINSLSKPVEQPQPTETELLKQQLLETQAILAEMQYNNLLKENGGM